MKMFLSGLARENTGKLLMLSALILLVILYTLPWTVKNSLERDYSGIDFHAYWYAGHYLRAGKTPYAILLVDRALPIYWDPRIPGSGDPNQSAIREGDGESELKLPIHYLDGPVVNEYPVARMMITPPSVTAPLSLILGLSSWLSWETARLIWMILNLIFAAMIPWLALRLINEPNQLRLVDKFIFAFVFYNMYGLRQSIVVGQQTLICLLLLILALIFNKNWVISGILLGFGISKYSVGLPIVIYLLMQQKKRTVIVSVLVQVVALLFLMPLRLGSPLKTLLAYYKVIAITYSQEGVHLSARFTSGPMPIVLSMIILAATVLVVARQFYYQRKLRSKDNISINDLSLITVAVFLVAYHRIHDMPFMIFFLLPLTTNIVESRCFLFNRTQSVTFCLVSIVIISLLLFPTLPYQVAAQLEILKNIPARLMSVEAVSTVVLILMFATSVWVQLKLPFRTDLSAVSVK